MSATALRAIECHQDKLSAMLGATDSASIIESQLTAFGTHLQRTGYGVATAQGWVGQEYHAAAHRIEMLAHLVSPAGADFGCALKTTADSMIHHVNTLLKRNTVEHCADPLNTKPLRQWVKSAATAATEAHVDAVENAWRAYTAYMVNQPVSNQALVADARYNSLATAFVKSVRELGAALSTPVTTNAPFVVPMHFGRMQPQPLNKAGETVPIYRGRHAAGFERILESRAAHMTEPAPYEGFNNQLVRVEHTFEEIVVNTMRLLMHGIQLVLYSELGDTSATDELEEMLPRIVDQARNLGRMYFSLTGWNFYPFTKKRKEYADKATNLTDSLSIFAKDLLAGHDLDFDSTKNALKEAFGDDIAQMFEDMIIDLLLEFGPAVNKGKEIRAQYADANERLSRLDEVDIDIEPILKKARALGAALTEWAARTIGQRMPTSTEAAVAASVDAPFVAALASIEQPSLIDVDAIFSRAAPLRGKYSQSWAIVRQSDRQDAGTWVLPTNDALRRAGLPRDYLQFLASGKPNSQVPRDQFVATAFVGGNMKARKITDSRNRQILECPAPLRGISGRVEFTASCNGDLSSVTRVVYDDVNHTRQLGSYTANITAVNVNASGKDKSPPAGQAPIHLVDAVLDEVRNPSRDSWVSYQQYMKQGAAISRAIEWITRTPSFSPTVLSKLENAGDWAILLPDDNVIEAMSYVDRDFYKLLNRQSKDGERARVHFFKYHLIKVRGDKQESIEIAPQRTVKSYVDLSVPMAVVGETVFAQINSDAAQTFNLANPVSVENALRMQGVQRPNTVWATALAAAYQVERVHPLAMVAPKNERGRELAKKSIERENESLASSGRSLSSSSSSMDLDKKRAQLLRTLSDRGTISRLPVRTSGKGKEKVPVALCATGTQNAIADPFADMPALVERKMEVAPTSDPFAGMPALVERKAEVAPSATSDPFAGMPALVERKAVAQSATAPEFVPRKVASKPEFVPRAAAAVAQSETAPEFIPRTAAAVAPVAPVAQSATAPPPLVASPKTSDLRAHYLAQSGVTTQHTMFVLKTAATLTPELCRSLTVRGRLTRDSLAGTVGTELATLERNATLSVQRERDNTLTLTRRIDGKECGRFEIVSSASTMPPQIAPVALDIKQIDEVELHVDCGPNPMQEGSGQAPTVIGHELVALSGVLDACAGQEFTLFLPADPALIELGVDKLNALRRDRDALRKLLRRHLVVGDHKYCVSKLTALAKQNGSLTALDGTELRIEIDAANNLYVRPTDTNDAVRIMYTNGVWDGQNGWVHAIVGVL